MKLIYIRSTMVPKNYNTLRSLLKQEQGEKIAPYIFKLKSTQTIKDYLDQETIIYEVYQEESIEKPPKRTLDEPFQKPRKKRKIED